MLQNKKQTLVKDLIRRNRSYRRFSQEKKLSKAELIQLVDSARLSPSSGNVQPLRYVLSWQKEKNDEIFKALSWASGLKDWEGPAVDERPTGYIIIMMDKRLSRHAEVDAGIAAQSILISAVEKELGGCIIGAVQKERLRIQLEIPSQYKVIFVVALGKPAETVVLEDAEEGKVKYFRDEDDIHHVPKRPLSELVLDI
ncbi:MAG: nitroreductase family protein [Spirochaetia bacterium]